MGKKSHEGVYRLKMASSSLFVFFNVHTDGSKWDLRWTALDPRLVSKMMSPKTFGVPDPAKVGRSRSVSSKNMILTHCVTPVIWMDNMSRDFAELFFTNISVNKISNACNSKAQDASKCKSKEMTTDYCGYCVRFICQQ